MDGDDLPATKVPVAFDGECSAEELEQLIVELAKARASLAPAVPDSPPSLLHEGEILVQDDARHSFRRLANGGLRIWLRNEGIGWLAFTLSPTDVAGIREFLSKQPGDTNAAH